MNWFGRHLNWTSFIFYSGSDIILKTLWDSYTVNDTIEFVRGAMTITSLCILLIGNLLIQGWFLKAKSRSLWFLLLLIIPLFGYLIILLGLDNMRDVRSSHPQEVGE